MHVLRLHSYFANTLNSFHAFNDLTENAITKARGCIVPIVQRLVLCNIDKELTGCAVHDHGTGHSNSADIV